MYYKIKREIYGYDSYECARVLNGLGYLYLQIGDYSLAEEYLSSSLVIFEKIFGKEHYAYTFPLGNLGRMDYYKGNNLKALELCRSATEIYEKALGLNASTLSVGLSFLGDIYMALGRLNEADSVLKKEIDVIEDRYGNQHPRYASGLYNIAKLATRKGNFKDAENYLNMAMKIYSKNYDGNIWDRFYCENLLGKVSVKTNQLENTLSIYNNIFIKKSKEIAENFEWLNDNQKEAYWKKESEFYNDLSVYADLSFEKVPEAVSLNYNAALLSKSKVLESKISSESYYDEIAEIRDELIYRRRLLAKLESEGSTERERLYKLRVEADSLDKRLTLNWLDYAEQKKNLNITWELVQQNLEHGEAAIEFIRFKNVNDSQYYYNELVIKKAETYPTLIKLCKERDLISINPSTGFGSYYKLVWQPLEIALNGIKTIYYSPDGELNNIPFHAIYSSNGKGGEEKVEYLMDRYTLHQLTSTRYLAMNLKLNQKKSISNDILLVGGVNYEYLPGIKNEGTNGKNDKNLSRSSQFGFGRLEYLDGTKIEVEKIAKNVMTKNWQVTKLENNEATEDNIIKQENKEAKAIIHIATHGFAFPEYNFSDSTISKNSLRYTYRYSNNPMVRSGLILAGGNWAWTGSDTLTKMGAFQKGILTALEVSQLNLKKTKLVVLSACETGLGKIEVSEGTFGLKRGFKLAGVEQLIVSLWSVPDDETMELMTYFYTYLSNTLNSVSSFEKAQKEMRNKYPNHPEKWAGFVLVR